MINLQKQTHQVSFIISDFKHQTECIPLKTHNPTIASNRTHILYRAIFH